jgi:6-phosphogluconolactonase
MWVMDVGLRVVADPAREVAELLAGAARAGESIALTGGSTPRRAYELAAELEPDWSRATVWWGDERCVPPDDERSNFGMAKAALLDRLAAPPREVHRILGELEPVEAAQLYERELRGVTLDLVLLGIGPDGHTASLFPDAATLDEHERLVVAAEAGLQPFVARVTLTLPAIGAARRVVFLVTGPDKAGAVARAFGHEPSKATPASLARGQETTVILDDAAAEQLAR